MMLRISIQSYRKVEDTSDSYTVFCIEVCDCGRIYTVEKRYSEFEDLHKKLKKCMSTPEFPPKKVLKWSNKVLEHRKTGLQTYLQGVLTFEPLPKILLKFLGAGGVRTNTDTGSLSSEDVEINLTHQPLIGFQADAFLNDNNSRSLLRDIILEGVHQGLYNQSDIYR